jgi:hypothetical protein
MYDKEDPEFIHQHKKPLTKQEWERARDDQAKTDYEEAQQDTDQSER